MRKTLLTLSLVLGTGLLSFAYGQFGCGGGRYLQEIFSNVDVTSDITYGSNINLQNQTQSLELDVYEPQGDTEPLRPLIVMAHGGSFIGGSKDQVDITSLANPLAKMGYVIASIEYRLGMEGLPFPGPDSSTATESVLRGVHDMKAAVRFFYKSAQTGNPYKIDTNAIYVGGVSAGAFVALHMAYLDDSTEIPSYIDTTKAGLGGGIEGNSGNPGYNSEVQGVINICGALGEVDWLDPGDEPLVSLHGTDDVVVPYGTDVITVAQIFSIMEVDGSATIHQRANSVGVDNCFFTYQGAGHTPHINTAAYLDTTLNVVKNFMYGLVCGGSGQCGYITDAAEPLAPAQVEIFPNPAHQALNLRAPAGQNFEVMMLDMNGREVMRFELTGGEEKTINRNGLPAGLYLLRGISTHGKFSSKIIFD